MNQIKIIYLGALLFGALLVSKSTYILAKACLANILIQAAWSETLKTKTIQKAWSWADSHPIAELMFLKQGVNQVVLEEAIGRNLAFAPARVVNSGRPGEKRSTIISAHNDTHFKHLAQISLDDLVEIKTLKGIYTYQVESIQIVDSRTSKINILNRDELVLTTCYPFKQMQTGTPYRYVITAGLVNKV